MVREIDIYFCTSQLQGTKVVVLQYPLRPPWRPYDAGGFSDVRVKPRALKLEMKAALETNKQYNKQADPDKRITEVPLTSHLVSTGTTFAVGSVRNGRLFLTPIDGALHMRPSLTHLDGGPAVGGSEQPGAEARAAAALADRAKQEEGAGPSTGPGLVPLTVQVRKRENERQAAARLSSYAYLQQQLDEEPWVDLEYVDINNDAADVMWHTMMEPPPGSGTPETTGRGVYLEAIVPGLSGRAMADAAAQAAAMADHTSAQGRAEAGPTAVAAKQISQEARDALPGALTVLFRHQALANVADIRAFLDKLPEDGAAKEWVGATDVQLHEAVAAIPTLLFLRRVYLPKSLSNAALDPLRTLVLQLFAEKETLKRAEIYSAAKGAGLSINDSLYNKVMRAVCESKGGQWSLRTGADLA